MHVEVLDPTGKAQLSRVTAQWLAVKKYIVHLSNFHVDDSRWLCHTNKTIIGFIETEPEERFPDIFRSGFDKSACRFTKGCGGCDL